MDSCTKKGDTPNVCPLHSAVVTELKTDMSWVKKRLESQNTQLWGITIGVVFVLLKILFS